MRKSSEARRQERVAVLHLYRDVWQLLRGQRRPFVAAVALLIGAQIALLVIPYLSGRALNALQLRGTAGFGEAARWLAAALLVACGSWMLHGPARLLERNSAITIRRRMSATLLVKLFALPLRWHESHHSGATAHRVHQSTQALSAFTQSQFIYLNSLVRLIGPLAALLYLLPAVGMAAMVGFALIVLSVTGFDRAMLRLANDENDAERRYTAALVDSLGNVGTVYALRQARLIAARLERKLLPVFVPLRKAIVLNEAKWFTVDIATRLLSCTLVGLFVWLSARNGMRAASGGSLLLGSIYMVWEYAQQSAGVIASIASHFQTFARQHADYAGADVILRADAPPAAQAGRSTTADWRRISIRNLTFRHAAGRGGRAALERVSFSLERGKRYALIGASGSGKSTLLRVLAGLHAADQVAVTFDEGTTFVSPADAAGLLRSQATMIPQDAEVFEGTLGENLGLCESVTGPPTAADYPLALRTSCASDFVDATPAGLDANVAERAANWSGGQRGRLALARGILAANGSTLVLTDEPTASLDPSTESRVYANLFGAFAGACIVSSIHRLSLLGSFDEVLVMRDGELVSQGPPDELALTCTEFRRLTDISGHEARTLERHPSALGAS